MTFRPLGIGVGLRPPHYLDIEAGFDRAGRAREIVNEIQWFEAISENYLEPGGNPRRMLRRVREHKPVVLHGVAMSLGSVDPLNQDYLARLRALADEIEPEMISDHLCWGGVGGAYAHDLLPLPYTEEALDHVAQRVRQVQDKLGRRILVENVSSYVAFAHSVLTEWDFLGELARRADCGILLDVNNVFVSAHNHRFDARTFIGAMPRGRVGQIHLAGHSQNGELLLDTHDHAVRKEVWALYELALRTVGPVSTIIEWDDRIPSLLRLTKEVAKARKVAAGVNGENAEKGGRR